jgi:hypothetical protein
MTLDGAGLDKLDELLAAIRAAPDARRAVNEWKQVYKLLGQTALPAGRISGVVGMRDVAGLTGLVDQLRTPSPQAAGESHVDGDTLRKAMHAFRKRVSLTVLDEASKLGHGALTKGEDTPIPTAISPPVEFAAEVWQELVRQGRLRYVGHGMYELTGQ